MAVFKSVLFYAVLISSTKLSRIKVKVPLDKYGKMLSPKRRSNLASAIKASEVNIINKTLFYIHSYISEFQLISDSVCEQGSMTQIASLHNDQNKKNLNSNMSFLVPCLMATLKQSFFTNHRVGGQ
mgnify:CR=1 FL=1